MKKSLQMRVFLKLNSTLEQRLWLVSNVLEIEYSTTHYIELMIADDLSAVLINHHHSWAWEMSVDDVLTVFYVDDYSWLYISCLTDSDYDWPAMYITNKSVVKTQDKEKI